MPHSFTGWIVLYWLVISVVAVIVTITDKLLAIAHKRRVPEATLLLLWCVGGALAMFLCMLFIRHKTRKRKFMIGLPLIMVAQLAVIAGGIYLTGLSM